MEDFKCLLSTVESLEDYFSKENGPDGECRPCRLTPLASLYLGVLEGADPAQAEALSTAFDTQDILVIARAMDDIKKGAKDPVRKELENLDCFVQSYKEEGVDGDEEGREAV